ncbi:MAG: discoidin domain-containing protein, partial [Magnetococcales bacterium]|nr:discoidin domain-containing protein [Magnetococcales bacterium]
MAHRYWRVHITASTAGSNNLISLYEAEMRAPGGSVDLCSGGTVSASHANVDAIKLFDNNTSSYWNNGSPGVACWFQYDFGAANPVEIGELRMLPRYSNQSPLAFTCQWSDDTITWQTQGSWSNETGWSSAVWRSFTLPQATRPVVNAQRTQPIGFPLHTALRSDHDLGLFSHRPHHHLWSLRLETTHCQRLTDLLLRAHTHRYAQTLERTHTHRHALRVEPTRHQPWRASLEARSLQPDHDTLEIRRNFSWSLRHAATAGQSQPRADTWPVSPGARQQEFSLLTRNIASARRIAHWDLRHPESSIPGRIPPITREGVPLELIRATLSWHDDAVAWKLRLELADAATFMALEPEQPLPLRWDG